jgi:tetratricopeptide (TPR) repeat protein
MLWIILPFVVSVVALVLAVLWLSRAAAEVEVVQNTEVSPALAGWWGGFQDRFVQKLRVWLLRRYNALQSYGTKRRLSTSATPESLEDLEQSRKTITSAALAARTTPRETKGDSVRPTSKKDRVLRTFKSLRAPKVQEGDLIERIARNPKDIEAYELLGDLYMTRKDYDDAKACYRQVLRIDPHHASIAAKFRTMEDLVRS